MISRQASIEQDAWINTDRLRQPLLAYSRRVDFGSRLEAFDMVVAHRLRKRPASSRVGFTQVEVLVVIGIIALLVALSVPAVQRVRDAAARAHCSSNLLQLALGVHQFEATHRKLPEGCAYPLSKSRRDLMQQAGVSWQTAILPFIEQVPLWNLAWEAQNQDPIGTHSLLHRQVMETTLPVLLCPTETLSKGQNAGNGWSWAVTTYPGVAGSNRRAHNGIFHKNFTVRFGNITDGSSNTLMIGERPAGPDGDFSGWYAEWGNSVCALSQILDAGYGRWNPGHLSCQITLSVFRPGRLGEMCDVNHFWSLHGGGANFAFADGSVRFLLYTSAPIVPALATRDGGEVVSPD
jgi:prepilin-type processing-associated H-X9-DG protein